MNFNNNIFFTLQFISTSCKSIQKLSIFLFYYLNKSLNSVGPEFSIGGNPIRTGKKLEIVYGCITIGNDKIRVQTVNQNSSSIVFQTDLEKGET